MKKFFILFSLLLISFTSFINVIASDTQLIDTPRILGRTKTDLQNVEINETSGFNNIVIFIKFADEANYTAPYNLSYYEDMFNGIGSISLRDYYLEVSYNELTIDSYLTGEGTNIVYYQDNQDRSYYQMYDEITNTNGYGASSGISQADREHELLKKAIDFVDENNLISDSIDLDVNNDGDIDSITFMVSGEDEGWNSLLWPHKWELSAYYDYYTNEYLISAPTIDGYYAYTYTFELLGNNRSYDRQVSVGILAHETFHLLSAPDLYHYYDYSHIEPIGDWGLMDNSPEIPSHMLGYMKEKYGEWIESVDEITESGVYTLEPLSYSADNLYKVDLGYSNEYLYIEYRLQEGNYESTLPDSGLIVYRVDEDYFELGNEWGYYTDQGNPRDEVFVFRPGINDVNIPIIFSDDGGGFIDEDGDIDKAAISNKNYFKEMGIGTNIVMFYSDGTLMNIKIYNIVEGDGYITFEILIGGIEPSIDLDSIYPISSSTELYLLDLYGLEYAAEINNIPDGANVYYTTDGTTPTQESTLYIGEAFLFNADSNVIQAAIYFEGEFINLLTKEFNFVTEIKTDHEAYGNNQDITWYIGLEDYRSKDTSFTLMFDEFFELELDFDFLYITYDSITTQYTGDTFPNTHDYSDDVLIRFTTDEWLDELYGFSVEFEMNFDVSITLVGETDIILEVGEDYIDSGVTITGFHAEFFELETIIDFDGNSIGEYVVTYNLVDSNNNVYMTVTRNITILDTIPPELTLIGDLEINIEVFSEYIDEGVSYIDNSITDLKFEMSGSVNNELLGTYIITYLITDESNNTSIVIRTINILDTTSPEADLNAGIDTLYVGETYVDTLVTYSDNYSVELELTVIGSVNTEFTGEYIIEYVITDGSLNETRVFRYVNVINKQKFVEFDLGKTLNTIFIDEEFIPASCSLGGELAGNSSSCEVDLTSVNTSVSGTYEVIYYIVINTIRFEKTSYVFVLNNDDSIIWHYDKSRRGYL